jgi:TfoX N-terminal domain
LPKDIRRLKNPSFSSLPSVKITSVLQMARNKVLEELLGDDLAQVRGITDKAMFGGRAWLLNGNLLCGARDDGMLVRLGKGNDALALSMPGIAPMIMQGRPMHGWVKAAPEVYEDDAQRRKLLKAALDFTGSLPKK